MLRDCQVLEGEEGIPQGPRRMFGNNILHLDSSGDFMAVCICEKPANCMPRVMFVYAKFQSVN